MDFFAQQDHARRKTKQLIGYFALAVISMIVMLYGVALFVTYCAGIKQQHQHYVAPPPVALWNPELFAGVALGTIAVIFLASAYKTMALSGGGGALAGGVGDGAFRR